MRKKLAKGQIVLIYGRVTKVESDGVNVDVLDVGKGMPPEIQVSNLFFSPDGVTGIHRKEVPACLKNE
jgi:hypothetical protein